MKKTQLLFCASMLAVLTACGGAPKKNLALEDARAEYLSASADENVVRYAPLELDAAKEALDEAHRGWKKGVQTSTTDHHANVATKRIDIARLIAERNQADEQLESMAGERKQVQLDLRSKEVNQKRLLLEQERVNSERARLEAASLKEQMAKLEAEKTERGMVLTLGDVLFDVGEATLKPGAERKIDNIADFMHSHSEKTVLIEGHTDSMGEEAYNLQLSEARANSVRLALVSRGIQSHRISTQGFGESLPVVSNDDRSGRQRNRRVEVIFPNQANNVVENYAE